MVFFADKKSAIDFWWIKPCDQSSSVQRNPYLDYYENGDFKNNAGSQMAEAMKNIARQFMMKEQLGKVKFGLDFDVGGVPRAYFDAGGEN